MKSFLRAEYMKIFIPSSNFNSAYQVKKMQLYEKFQPGLKYNSFKKIENLES